MLVISGLRKAYFAGTPNERMALDGGLAPTDLELASGILVLIMLVLPAIMSKAPKSAMHDQID